VATCLVLGGTGFLGSHIADALAKHGHKVRIFARHPPSEVDLWGPNHSMDVVVGDLVSGEGLSQALDGVEWVFHYASTTVPATSNADPAYDIHSNLVGTVRLLEKAVRCGVHKVIFPSSGGTVYGYPQQLPIPETHPTEPICSHGITKLAIEKYLALYEHLYGLDYLVLRCANPYGERQNPLGLQGAVSVFLGRIAHNQPITVWGDGSAVRDYIYVADAVDATLMALEATCDERIFNVGSGWGTSLNELVTLVARVTGRNDLVEYAPGRPSDVPINVLDASLIRRTTGWQPRVSFEEGVARTWEWVRRIALKREK
jgi:UDP-glucose 4-epimerase